jgi:D-3-phosphoglycerate dehydrogenase
MLILLSDSFDKSLPERLKQFGEVTTDKARQGEADVVLIRSKTTCDKAYIDGAPKLKLIIRGGVGLDNVDAKYAKEKGILVRNTPEASSVAVAELAFALMIAVPCHTVDAHNSMKEGKWLKKELERTELWRKTLGIVGIGRIGTELAKRAKAFEMRVVATDPVVKSHDVAELVPFETLLAESDYVSLNVPKSESTKGMINAETIAKMKKGVVIVNTGRAACIDEPALVAALESGRVGCYATDVWPSDPPPESCPIPKAPHVLMAPHLGASTAENLLRIGDIVVQQIGDFVKNGK